MAEKVSLVMADKDAEREAFEAWCVTQGWVEKPKARPNGKYVNGALQARWLGWWARACRDTSGVEACDMTRLQRAIRWIERYDGNLACDQTEKSEDIRYGLSLALRVLREEVGRITAGAIGSSTEEKKHA